MEGGDREAEVRPGQALAIPRGTWHRIIVDEKKWVGENRFLHALSYCMLLPGPEAHQLAIYIGWLPSKAWTSQACRFIRAGVKNVTQAVCFFGLLLAA